LPDAAAVSDVNSEAGTEHPCSAHLQMGVDAVGKGFDADLEIGATKGRETYPPHQLKGRSNRQVMAQTSSKSWIALAARVTSVAPEPMRRQRWVSTSFAEA
jgi:hypothetical protein